MSSPFVLLSVRCSRHFQFGQCRRLVGWRAENSHPQEAPTQYGVLHRVRAFFAGVTRLHLVGQQLPAVVAIVRNLDLVTPIAGQDTFMVYLGGVFFSMSSS